jgi:signal transduction histidine kinase
MNNLRLHSVCSPDNGRYAPGMKDFRLEQIGSATAGIAHDINNQLNLILNHLSLAQLDGTSIHGARQAAERCSALSTSLLSYCQNGRLELQSHDLSKLMRKAIPQLHVPDGIRLEIDVPQSLPLVRASSLGVIRALTNLVGNACEAMGGYGTLRITAAPQQIDVSDSGPGIPHDLHKRIFEPFFTTRGAAGTGLGLAIVRDIMREQGGYVSVVSEPGQGAHFTLRFRAA